MKKQITWIEQSSKEVEIFPVLAKKRTQMVVISALYQTPKEQLITISYKVVLDIRKKNESCLFYETGVILIPKTDEIIQENISGHLNL